MYNDFETWCEILTDYVGVDEEALRLAFAVGGQNIETAQQILFYYTGWNSFSGYMGELEDEED